MDTTEQITIVGSGSSLQDVLRSLYGVQSEEVTAAIASLLDQSIFKEMYDEFLKTADVFNSFFADVLRVGYPAPTKWYNTIDRHHYRKMHSITLRRVVKRRDRQSRGSVSLLKVEPRDEEELSDE